MEEKSPNICVVMSTYNGEKYFEEQIQSLLNQKKVNVSIYIRDDGSSEAMLQLLHKYESRDNIYIEYGNNLGYSKSFLKKLYTVPHFQYYAFCDQDDVWQSDKLYSAIEKMENYQSEPCLYFSSLTFVDDELNVLAYKNYDDMLLDFGCALVRNRISGCTMVFNEKLLELSKRISYNNDGLVSHDSWLYRLCLYVGGKIIYDRNSHILYRQHSNNVTGLKQGWKKRLSSEYKKIFVNSNWRYNIVDLLNEYYSDLVSEENKLLTEQILNYKKSFLGRLRLIFHSNVKSGIGIVDIFKDIAIILNKF